MNIIQFIVGLIGNWTAAACLFLTLAYTPRPTIQNKEVDYHSGCDHIERIYICLLWLLYGSPLVRFDVLLLPINVIGLVVAAACLGVSLRHKHGKELIISILKLAGFLLLFALNVFLTAVESNYDLRRFYIGILCCVWTFDYYMPQLLMMIDVIISKSTVLMSLPLSIGSFLNGLAWTAYGVITHDNYITIPYSFGAVFALVQFIVYGYYSTWREVVVHVLDVQVMIIKGTHGDNEVPSSEQNKDENPV